MALQRSPLFNFLGLSTQGDVGGWTFYTSRRRRLVFFPKSPPTSPPTPAQRARREPFRIAGLIWQTFDEHRRRTWHDAADRAHLAIHGYNLFTYYIITRDQSTIETVERQSGIELNLTT